MTLARALRTWDTDPAILGTIALFAAIYAAGAASLWRHAGVGRGLRVWQAAAFLGGTLALVAALVSPVAAASELLFSIHMTQHEILMLLAAPLLALARPLAVAVWALPPRARRRVGAWTRRPAVAGAWGRLTSPLAAVVLHAAALWIWHVPALYQAALASPALHALEHVCFVLTASLFWWALAHGRYGRLGYGLGVLYVFATALHTGALGALLTFAPRLLYPWYARGGASDPLADQQLAGLLMWIPFGVLFLVAALALFAAWLGESARRAGDPDAPAEAPAWEEGGARA